MIRKRFVRWFVFSLGIIIALGLFVETSTAMPLAANCNGTSVGFTPLNDLGTNAYKGYQGGLYPNGLNLPPSNYLQTGIAHTQAVRLLDGNGNPNANGKIVLLSIGMSNTTMEYSRFKTIADPDPLKNPLVVIVDGAQGGQDAVAIMNPNAAFWTNIDQRLTTAGVNAKQVQAAWLKEAIAGENKAFPNDATELQNDLQAIVQIMQSRYPNLQLIYNSSRIYAGYASSTLNPEPYAYQSGFAVKWLIQNQIQNGSSGAWLAWGPYTWADGLTPRSDGVTWACVEFQSDGTHPATSGQDKVANMLLNFFKTDSTARPWFVKNLPYALFLPFVIR